VVAADAGGSRGVGELAVLGGRPLGPQDPAVVGRYRIHALLGIGGMGRVYLGWAQNPGFGASRAGAWVAVKVIRPDLADNPEFRRRFARELETVGRVRTPYAAALVQGEVEAEQPWMVTEFVPGISLADAVQGGRALPATSVWRLAHDLGNALVAVHQAGIVHRDVKPSNVILGTGGAKIIDFGVAHASDLSQLTATGMNIGTPSYMAPEQAKTGDVSPASDMFSLGVLLYFAATGKLPFGEGGTAEVLFRVVYEEPDLSGLNDVEPQLRDLILRCMAKDPLQRPNAAGAVALARNAAGTGAWSPGDAVQWPEALAAQIHERTLAAGRTLPDPSLPELPESGGQSNQEQPSSEWSSAERLNQWQRGSGQQSHQQGQQQAAAQLFSAPPVPPLVLPSSDSEPTVFTGSRGSSRADAEARAAGRKRHGVLIATISTVAVLALGVGGYLVLRPGSDGAVSTAGGQASGSSADGGGAASGAATGGGAGAGAGASGSASASGSSSASAGASQSASAGTGAGAASGSAGAASAGAGTSAAAATSAAASATATGSSTSTGSGSGSGSGGSGTPNKYTAAEVCGSGYQSVASHSITGATIYLLYSNSAGENCVVTLATKVSGKVSMSATLQVQGGNTGSDSGSYTYYAGPVKEAASGKCVMYGGGYNGQSWNSGSWSYCGT